MRVPRSVVLVALGSLAVSARPADVRLPGTRYENEALSFTLHDVRWDPATNRVSGSLVLESAAELRGWKAPRFSIGTVDAGRLPHDVRKQPVAVHPERSRGGQRWTWTFRDVPMPEGERFAGVYLCGGSCLRGRGDETKRLRVRIALATARDPL